MNRCFLLFLDVLQLVDVLNHLFHLLNLFFVYNCHFFQLYLESVMLIYHSLKLQPETDRQLFLLLQLLLSQLNLLLIYYSLFVHPHSLLL